MSIYSSNVVSAVIGAVGGAIITYLTTSNNIDLEELKNEAAMEKIITEYKVNRCNEIKVLHKELSIGHQLLSGENREDFNSIALSLGELRSSAILAPTYFGDKAKERYLYQMSLYNTVNAGSENLNDKLFLPALSGLMVELMTCNSPNFL